MFVCFTLFFFASVARRANKVTSFFFQQIWKNKVTDLREKRRKWRKWKKNVEENSTNSADDKLINFTLRSIVKYIFIKYASSIHKSYVCFENIWIFMNRIDAHFLFHDDILNWIQFIFSFFTVFSFMLASELYSCTYSNVTLDTELESKKEKKNNNRESRLFQCERFESCVCLILI